MIVLLDLAKAVIKVYSEKGVRTLAFESSDLLKNIIGNRKVLYVTNGIPATVDEILTTVEAVKKQRSQQLRKEGEQLYLRSVIPGVLNIPGLYNRLTRKKEDLTFKGPFDVKMVSELARDYGKDIFRVNRSIAILLKTGKLQLLPESEYFDMKQRYENGDFVVEADKEHFQKKMKLLPPGTDPEEPISFDITKSVARMVQSEGRVSGREDNETGFIGGLEDISI